ncbi:MAG: hypothetical protein ACK5MR_17110 [Cumulibacter sp.]
MRDIPIANVPYSVTRAFETDLAKVDTQRERALASTAASDELFASLQARAFRGEL